MEPKNIKFDHFLQETYKFLHQLSIWGFSCNWILKVMTDSCSRRLDFMKSSSGKCKLHLYKFPRGLMPLNFIPLTSYDCDRMVLSLKNFTIFLLQNANHTRSHTSIIGCLMSMKFISGHSTNFLQRYFTFRQVESSISKI